MGEKQNIRYLVGGGVLIILTLALFSLIYFLGLETERLVPEEKAIPKPRIEQPRTESYPYGESDAFLLGEGTSAESRLYREARSTWVDLKNYNEALKKYEEAFRIVKNQDEKAQIKYEMALVKNESGDPIGAVQLLKEVAVLPEISNLMRASSIDQMGHIFYLRGDEKTFREIFTGTPFQSFLSENGSKRLSLVNLLEYGSSFYPLAWSQLEIADWYAKGLLLRRTDPSNEIAPKPPYRYSEEELKSLIQEKTKKAEEDISRLKQVYITDDRIVGFTFRKALIASKLERAGDPFLGNAEALFKQALDESRIMGVLVTEPFILYNFANHLARIDSAGRSQEIKSLLSNFYEGNKFDNSPFFEFLRNERTNVLNHRENIELLAGIDPNFKEFLNTQAGWNL